MESWGWEKKKVEVHERLGIYGETGRCQIDGAMMRWGKVGKHQVRNGSLYYFPISRARWASMDGQARETRLVDGQFNAEGSAAALAGQVSFSFRA